jgi:polysaccharide export outer membrane protein
VVVKKLALLLAAVVALLACASSHGHPVDLPPAQLATKLGVGDVFEVHIVGEDKLPIAFTIAPDGSADLPYVHRVRVEGLEPQELSTVIRDKLIAEQILTNPSVSISVKEYNSQKVEMLGEVVKPGSYPLQPGMKLLRALAGGFTTLANRSHVVIRRRLPGGGTKAATVDVEEITDNKIPDPQLQAGDSVNVDQRLF